MNFQNVNGHFNLHLINIYANEFNLINFSEPPKHI